MALDEARAGGTHGGGCTCGDCPHGAREGHRRAVAAFLAKRDELAAGQGLPPGVAQSASATRQWVSDELTQSARTVAERGREAGEAWLYRVWRRTLIAVWAGVALLVIGEAVTAIGAGWTNARTAGLVAGLVTAGLLTGAAHVHRARGGLLAPLIGEDHRLSTSRAVAASWVLLAVFSVLVLALQLAGASGHTERDELIEGLDLARGAGVVTVLALVCAVAVVVRRVVTVRTLSGRLQKLRAVRPRAADLLTDDSGRGSFTDVQYVLVSTVAVLFAAVRLARRPEQLPDLPWGLALLVTVSALAYFAGKYAEGGRPVILSVVRAREAGDLDAPVRTGDDIEIRGAGFVPPGAGTPERLARLVVRIGRVHVHVPLIPVTGGFANPADGVLTVPVPVEVEPGVVQVQVVTAAGVETNRVEIDVTD
ncbi:membrane protein [Streptomyces sanglieri]|uniref:Integral membrane protein n=2 Tax=Streptomyces TaxID=1883 RepID=A0ABW2WXW2_9ACTN